jgi:hypothetical protein
VYGLKVAFYAASYGASTLGLAMGLTLPEFTLLAGAVVGAIYLWQNWDTTIEQLGDRFWLFRSVVNLTAEAVKKLVDLMRGKGVGDFLGGSGLRAGKDLWNQLFGGGDSTGIQKESFRGGGGGLFHNISGSMGDISGGGGGVAALDFPRGVFWRLDRIIELMVFGQRIMGAGFTGIPGWTSPSGLAEGRRKSSFGGSGASPGSGTGGGSTGRGEYNVRKAYDLIKSVGGTDEEARTLAAIAQPESGGNPTRVNNNSRTGDLSYGLWQINMLGAMGPERRRRFGLSSNEELKNPATNARVALAMARSAHGYRDWSTYKSGAYRQYLPKAGFKPISGRMDDTPDQSASPDQSRGRGIASAFAGDGRGIHSTPHVDDRHIDDAIRKVQHLKGLLKSMERPGFSHGASLQTEDGSMRHLDNSFGSSHRQGG